MRAQAIFAAGCFWGVEHRFRQVKGVLDAEAGYSGGRTENPTYEQVRTGRTGHAEAVRLEFAPSVVSYGKLLDVFWGMHDPTTPNRQGPDAGSQYRSAIFYMDVSQRVEAERSRDRQRDSGRFARPIITEISPAGRFWRAEEYHQRYSDKNGVGGCRV